MWNKFVKSVKIWFGKRDNRLNAAAIVLAACLVWFACAQLNAGSYKDIDLSAAAEKIDGIAPDANALKKLFGLEADDYDSFTLRVPGSAMDVTEVLIAKSADAGAMDRAEEAVRTRLASQQTAFENYGTDQSFLLNNAIVWRGGDYLFYAVGEENGTWHDAFIASVR